MSFRTELEQIRERAEAVLAGAKEAEALLADADKDGVVGLLEAVNEDATRLAWKARHMLGDLRPCVSALVAEPDACWSCGEQRMDRLVWQDDGDVECQVCKTRYMPRRELGATKEPEGNCTM